MTISIDGIQIPVTKFPDKTTQVWKLPEGLMERTWLNVQWDFEEEAELIHLSQLKDLLDAYDIQAYLNISYLPYGRQDKEVSNDATFALRTFARILNSMNFYGVTIMDPHSPEALQLIKSSNDIYPDGEVWEAFKSTGADLACYPDKGAHEKYDKLYGFPYIYAEKVRDQSTGTILYTRVHGDCEGKTVLIVDDICDGGRTFIEVAKELLDNGATAVHLFVTHGIFSKGMEPLSEAGIERVFTKNGEVL